MATEQKTSPRQRRRTRGLGVLKGIERPELEPDLARLTDAMRGQLNFTSGALIGLLVLALLYTLYFAQLFVIPILLALLMNFLFRPVLRPLKRLGLGTGVGAGIIMLGLLAALGAGLYSFTNQVEDWMDNLPRHMATAEYKLRGIQQSVERIEEAAEAVGEISRDKTDPQEPDRVRISEPTIVNTMVGGTRRVFFGLLVTLVLTYFLLASDDLFLNKLVDVLPQRTSQKKAIVIIRRVERSLSRYLFTITLVNLGLATVLAAVFYLYGLPNPILWGIVAGLLNFVPLVGGIIGAGLVGLAAIIAFDNISYALLIPLTYMVINAIEGYLITPSILGRWLTLNPVAILLSVIFWGWLWGIAGVLIAVPLLMAFKIVCDNIELLAPIGVFLGR